MSKQFKLAVFDFDATITDDNSDTYLNKLFSLKYLKQKDLLAESDHEKCRFIFPEEVELLYKTHNWPTRMNAALEYYFKFGFGLDEMLNELKKIQISDKMKKLLKKLKQNGFDLIILSDANDLFIKTILEANQMLDLFDKSRIFTNPSYVDALGLLKIEPYYLVKRKDHPVPYECKLCLEYSDKPSICKALVLKAYLEELKLKYGSDIELRLIYTGDGINDYCPGLILTENDYFCPRLGFNLADRMLKNEELVKVIKARIVYWENADDLAKKLELLD